MVLPFFRLADVLPHPGLVQAHRAHAVPCRPEVQPCHPTLMRPLAMNADRPLPFPRADRLGHTLPGPDAQAEADAVGHRMPFHQVDPALSTQVPKDPVGLPTQPSVGDIPTGLGWDHCAAVAIPPDMGQDLPFVHGLLLPAPRGLPEGRAHGLSKEMHAGSLEALWLTRP